MNKTKCFSNDLLSDRVIISTEYIKRWSDISYIKFWAKLTLKDWRNFRVGPKVHQFCKHKGLLVLYVKNQESIWVLAQRWGTILSLSSELIIYLVKLLARLHLCKYWNKFVVSYKTWMKFYNFNLFHRSLVYTLNAPYSYTGAFTFKSQYINLGTFQHNSLTHTISGEKVFLYRSFYLILKKK